MFVNVSACMFRCHRPVLHAILSHPLPWILRQDLSVNLMPTNSPRVTNGQATGLTTSIKDACLNTLPFIMPLEVQN